MDNLPASSPKPMVSSNGQGIMKLLCIICAFTNSHSEDNPSGEADLVINGQSVCLDHAGYVQGGDFSLSVARANQDREERIRQEAERHHD